MTIPLDTYDPNWEAKWDSILAEIEAELDQPNSDERRDRLTKLDVQLRAAYHAQFRTTGDYAASTEDRIRSEASYKTGIEDFIIPSFPLNNSIEATDNLYELVSKKIEIVDKAETAGSLKLIYPIEDQPFAYKLDAGESRVDGLVSYEFRRQVFKGDVSVGFKLTTEPYTCILEKRHLAANVCFLGVDGDGPSVVNCIEELIIPLYRSELGPESTQKNGEAYLPEEVHIYIYFPPYCDGEEQLWKTRLTRDTENQLYIDPEWRYLTEVPYVLRKLAAADGLAKHPGPPRPSVKESTGGNNSLSNNIEWGPK